jgi:hypothetical protein
MECKPTGIFERQLALLFSFGGLLNWNEKGLKKLHAIVQLYQALEVPYEKKDAY